MSCVRKNNVIYGADFNGKIDERGLGAFVFDACDKFSDRIVQHDHDRGLSETFRSLKERSIRCALAFRSLGVNKGDIILSCSYNTLDQTPSLLACFLLGAVTASTDPTMSVKETRSLIQIAQPRFVVVQDVALSLIEESLQGTGLAPKIIVIGKSEKYVTIEELLSEEREGERDFKPAVVADVKKETAAVVFSSGSTGLSKGICLTHYGLLKATYLVLNKGLGSQPGVVFHVSSMYWISAMNLWIYCFITGSKKILTANTEIENVLSIIEKYQVTTMFLASMYSYKITSYPNLDRYDLSSVESFCVGGSYLPGEQIMKCRKVFKKPAVTMGYGMTEVSGVICLFHLKNEIALAERKSGSTGTVADSMILKIVNPETNQVLGPNQRGEIRILMDTFMLGYLGRDASGEFDEEGFLKTGDIGYYDEDNCVYVVDRIKEMFKYQSWHIMPGSIEKEMYSHPQILEAVAFGVPHGMDGDLPAACVVLQKGATVTEEELLEYINSRVSEREKLRGGLKIVEKFPQTASGKPRRNETRDMYIKLINK